MGFGGGGGRLATFADLSFSACRAFFLALIALWESKVKCFCSVLLWWNSTCHRLSGRLLWCCSPGLRFMVFKPLGFELLQGFSVTFLCFGMIFLLLLSYSCQVRFLIKSAAHRFNDAVYTLWWDHYYLMVVFTVMLLGLAFDQLPFQFL